MKTVICKSLATLGPLGSLMASGTIGSLVAVPFAVLLNYGVARDFHILILILLTSIAWLVIYTSSYCYAEKDPREIILDEVIGCLFAFYAVPLKIELLICAFLLFRLFDITKIGGISYLEKLNGASGILFDDIAAGLYANCAIQCWLFFTR